MTQIVNPLYNSRILKFSMMHIHTLRSDDFRYTNKGTFGSMLIYNFSNDIFPNKTVHISTMDIDSDVNEIEVGETIEINLNEH
jgi:hypothetical protein